MGHTLWQSDAEFEEHMQVKSGVIPDLYQTYVKEVQCIINSNARLEFECMWRHKEKTDEPMSIISDLLSNKIVHLRDAILNSDRIWHDEQLRSKVIHYLRDTCLRSREVVFVFYSGSLFFFFFP